MPRWPNQPAISEETRAKLSAISRQRWSDPTYRATLLDVLKDRNWNSEQAREMANRPRPPETGANISAAKIRHGHATQRRLGKSTPTYITWCSMRQRCNDPNCRSYPDYGGRGITVCERWDIYENFLADMGEKPRGLSIDRIDNDGNYEPSNCRWATNEEQQQNKRPRRRKTVAA